MTDNKENKNSPHSKAEPRFKLVQSEKKFNTWEEAHKYNEVKYAAVMKELYEYDLNTSNQKLHNRNESTNS
jgi:hypothetical protein